VPTPGGVDAPRGWMDHTSLSDDGRTPRNGRRERPGLEEEACSRKLPEAMDPRDRDVDVPQGSGVGGRASILAAEERANQLAVDVVARLARRPPITARTNSRSRARRRKRSSGSWVGGGVWARRANRGVTTAHDTPQGPGGKQPSPGVPHPRKPPKDTCTVGGIDSAEGGA